MFLRQISLGGRGRILPEDHALLYTQPLPYVKTKVIVIKKVNQRLKTKTIVGILHDEYRVQLVHHYIQWYL